MYFPHLENIQNFYGEEEEYIAPIIRKLDYWLASRRISIKNYLSPSSFGSYCEIQDSLALELFELCTYPDISILRVRFDVVSHINQYKHGSFYNVNEIPKEIYNPELDLTEIININDVLIYYELIEAPIKPVATKSSSFEDAPSKNKPISLNEYNENKARVDFRMGQIWKEKYTQ